MTKKCVKSKLLKLSEKRYFSKDVISVIIIAALILALVSGPLLLKPGGQFGSPVNKDCIETDFGQNIFVYGEATGYTVSPLYKDEPVTLGDKCLPNGNLYEASCEYTSELIKKVANNPLFLEMVYYYKSIGVRKLVYWSEIACSSGCNETAGACIVPTHR